MAPIWAQEPPIRREIQPPGEPRIPSRPEQPEIEPSKEPAEIPRRTSDPEPEIQPDTDFPTQPPAPEPPSPDEPMPVRG